MQEDTKTLESHWGGKKKRKKETELKKEKRKKERKKATWRKTVYRANKYHQKARMLLIQENSSSDIAWMFI